jgi:hypothetical protein
MGLMVTVPISYIFVSDALIKLALNHLMRRPVFGQYASYDDLIMPASWILMGAFTWDFVPRLLRAPPSGRMSIIVELSRPIILALSVMLVATIFVPNIHVSNLVLDFRSYIGLGMVNLTAAALSCLVFPALIATERRYTALFLAIAGIMVNLLLLCWATTFAPSILESVINTVRMLASVNVALIILCSGLLYLFSMRTSRATSNTL